jgi:hypothetical protein
VNPLHTLHVAYRLFRRKLHVRLVASMRKKRLAVRVDAPSRFDERSSMDRFRRESSHR